MCFLCEWGEIVGGETETEQRVRGCGPHQPPPAIRFIFQSTNSATFLPISLRGQNNQRFETILTSLFIIFLSNMFYFYRLNWNSKCEGVVKECKNMCSTSNFTLNSLVICYLPRFRERLSMANVCGYVIFKQITDVEWFAYTLVPLWGSVRHTNMLHVFNISSCPSFIRIHVIKSKCFLSTAPCSALLAAPGPANAANTVLEACPSRYHRRLLTV